MSQPPLKPPAPESQTSLRASRGTGPAGAPGLVLEVDTLGVKRKHPKSKLSSDIRRSASSPHIREMAQGDIGGHMPNVDKRRNKLGYQRTNIACSHCRRRKIRCLLPIPDDFSGRCINCIRLKKECNFYPVDHPGTDLRPTATGRRDIGSTTLPSSTTTSPRTPALQIPPAPADPPSGVSFEQPADFQTSKPEEFDKLTMNGGSYQPAFPYSHVGENESWGSPSFPSHPPSQSAISPYWASSHSTPASGFHPNSLAAMGHSPSPGPGYDSPHMASQHGSQSWVPSRSSSYSQIENPTPGFSYQDLRSQSNVPPNTMNYQLNTPLDAGTAHPGAATDVQQTSQMISPASLPNYTYQQPWLAGSEQYARPPVAEHGNHIDPEQWYPEAASGAQLGSSSQPTEEQYSHDAPYYPHVTHPV